MPKLDLTDRVVAALLHLRFNAPSPLIGQLLGVNRITAARAVKEMLPLLEQHRYIGPPQPIARIHTVGDARAYITAAKRTARSSTTATPRVAENSM